MATAASTPNLTKPLPSTTHGSWASHLKASCLLGLAQMARKIVLQPALTRRSRGDLHLSGSLRGSRSTSGAEPPRPQSHARYIAGASIRILQLHEPRGAGLRLSRPALGILCDGCAPVTCCINRPARCRTLKDPEPYSIPRPIYIGPRTSGPRGERGCHGHAAGVEAEGPAP